MSSSSTIVCLLLLILVINVNSNTSKVTETPESFGFQADVKNLLNILINSLYTNRDIFLRELVSNASDALDKIRFLILSNSEELDSTSNLEIRIQADPEANTISIRDYGIGMTKEELVKHLGSIAKSGTSDFIQAIQKGGDNNNLIGQFGVGFYSAFLVATRVDVISKSNDADKQYIWSSDASSTYTITEDPRGNTLERGTEILLHMKEDARDYLDDRKLAEILDKYAQFINFPIYLWANTTDLESTPYSVQTHFTTFEDETQVKFTDDDADFPELEELNPEDSEKILEEHYRKSEPKIQFDDDVIEMDTSAAAKKSQDKKEVKDEPGPEFDWKQVNSNKPIWTRSPSEVSDEEHSQFFKSLTVPSAEPLAHTHFFAESPTVSFRGLFYIPTTKPIQLFDDTEHTRNIKLYIRRVFITDQFQGIIPRYINFVKGVIDSDDLPLNVNREMLSESSKLKIMRKKILRKILGMISKLAQPESDSDEDVEAAKEKYEKFWTQFGPNIKLGVIEDTTNRQRLASLLRFPTTLDPEGLYSLDEVIEASSDGDKVIYWIAGKDKAILAKSPMISKLVSSGNTILLLDQTIDEYCIGTLKTYKKRRFVDVTKRDSELENKGEDPFFDQVSLTYQSFVFWFEKILDGKVKRVEFTTRLDKAPAILTTDRYGYSANMERIAKSQAFGDDTVQKLMASKKILSLNPYHPLVYNLAMKTANPDGAVSAAAETLYEYARLASGFEIEDVPSFLDRLSRFLSLGLGVKPSAKMIPANDVLLGLAQLKKEMVSGGHYHSPVEVGETADEVGETAELDKMMQQINTPVSEENTEQADDP